MKKSYLFLTIIYSILVFSGCGSAGRPDKNHSIDYKDFKHKISLKGNSLKLAGCKMPMDILVIPEEHLLLVIDIGNQQMIRAYDLESMDFIKAFVNKGAAPNQQISCRHMQYDPVNKHILSTDTYKKKIFVYRVEDVKTLGTNVYPIADISLNRGLFNKPVVLNSSILDIHSKSESDRENYVFDEYSRSGKFSANKGHLPELDIQIPVDLFDFAFTNGERLSQDGSKIVLTYRYTDFIDVYDSTGTLMRRAQGPSNFNPDVTITKIMGGTMPRPTPKSKKAFCGKPVMTKDLILTLYDGNFVSEEYHVTQLLEFTTQLNPQKIYGLNIPVFAMDFDSKTKTVYALTHKNKEHQLIKYNL